MHPKKEDMLKNLDYVSRIHDASVKRPRYAIHPDKSFGESGLLTAGSPFPRRA